MDGKPQIVEQQLPGQRRGGHGPAVEGGGGGRERIHLKEFDNLAAVWGILMRPAVIEAIGGVCGPRRADAGAWRVPTWHWPR